MVSNVRGELGPVTGTVWLDEQDVTRSRVEVTIDARGLDTRNEKRDEHLRSPDFFDVQTHPFVTFKSTSVRKGAGGALKVAGDLTIRGVTKPIVLDVDPLPAAINDPWGNTKRGAAARATLDRKAWGLTWNAAIETGGVAVGEKVAIEIEAELVRRKDGVAKKE
jgi:polyisoprenoid-binding protein YceI